MLAHFVSCLENKLLKLLNGIEYIIPFFLKKKKCHNLIRRAPWPTFRVVTHQSRNASRTYSHARPVSVSGDALEKWWMVASMAPPPLCLFVLFSATSTSSLTSITSKSLHSSRRLTLSISPRTLRSEDICPCFHSLWCLFYLHFDSFCLWLSAVW